MGRGLTEARMGEGEKGIRQKSGGELDMWRVCWWKEREKGKCAHGKNGRQWEWRRWRGVKEDGEEPRCVVSPINVIG